MRLVNLNFHGIGPATRRAEPGERELWLSPPQFQSLLDAVAGRDDVRITFDDGNASDVEHALPELRARGLKATFFLVAGRLGEPGFLGAGDVRELVAAGMDLGCHGMRHRPWRGLDDRALHEELVVARRLLEEIVEGPVGYAACPFGSYDRRVLGFLRRCGYERVYTSDRGTTRRDAWLQARNSVGRSDASDLVDRIVAPGRRRSAALRRGFRLAAKRWR